MVRSLESSTALFTFIEQVLLLIYVSHCLLSVPIHHHCLLILTCILNLNPNNDFDMAPRARKHTSTLCDKSYINPDDLTAHKISEHGASQLPCSQTGCTRTFKSPRTLKRHVKEQHEKQSFSCSFCNFSCAHQKNVKKHKRSCRDKPVALPATTTQAQDNESTKSAAELFDLPELDFLPCVDITEPATPQPIPGLCISGDMWETLGLTVLNQNAALGQYRKDHDRD